ncbi:hypothetical protein ACFYPN_07155 [Streptomyces sp. NPDC005576]
MEYSLTEEGKHPNDALQQPAA